PTLAPSALESDPAGSEATATPVPLPEVAQGAVSWMLPLVWLEKSLNASSLLDSLRHSLVTPVVTPVPTAVAGTFMTPPDLRDKSMNTSAGGLPCAKDSAAETDSLLCCPREQLKSLPRAELEGRLESTLIIIEALSLQLRDWQESQRPLPGVGPAEQRDALTQTDITHPKGVRVLAGAMPPLFPARPMRPGWPPLAPGFWEMLVLLAHTAAVGYTRCRLLSQQEQARALVSRCRAMLESVPGKLRSCLEERGAMRQRADEALRAKEEVGGAACGGVGAGSAVPMPLMGCPASLGGEGLPGIPRESPMWPWKARNAWGCPERLELSGWFFGSGCVLLGAGALGCSSMRGRLLEIAPRATPCPEQHHSLGREIDSWRNSAPTPAPRSVPATRAWRPSESWARCWRMPSTSRY
uniref:Uncharacterized protein n=1 Tax=Aquila chrysaetos chrysaetos TaxID=223781 RepID=A0A663F221_AQUCH